jgi:hypothetical protein
MLRQSAYLILLLTLFIDLTKGFAQTTELHEGDYVRVMAPIVSSDTLEGEITLMDFDRIIISHHKNQREIPWLAMSMLEIRTSHRNTGKGALIGAGTGGIILGLLLLSDSGTCNSDEELCLELFTPAEGFLVGLVLGGIIGVLPGLIVGDMIVTHEWVSSDLSDIMKVVAHPSYHKRTKPLTRLNR